MLGLLNDVWRYQVDEGLWIWINGFSSVGDKGIYGEKGVSNSTNMPGGRIFVVGAYDSATRDLWVFGGLGCDAWGNIGQLNDLWKFNINNNIWTWISGNATISKPGFYGEKGIPSPDNVPGAREAAVGWYNPYKNELWLFGGIGFGNDSNSGM